MIFVGWHVTLQEKYYTKITEFLQKFYKNDEFYTKFCHLMSSSTLSHSQHG